MLLGKGNKLAPSGINAYLKNQQGEVLAAANVDGDDGEVTVYNLTATAPGQGHGKALLRYICNTVIQNTDAKKRMLGANNGNKEVSTVTLGAANDKLKEVYEKWTTEFDGKLKVQKESDHPVSKGYPKDFRFLNDAGKIENPENPVLMPLLKSDSNKPRVPNNQLYFHTTTNKIYKKIQTRNKDKREKENGRLKTYTEEDAKKEGFFLLNE